MMTEQELAAIKARCEAATEGPWEVAWKTDYIWQLDGDGDRYEPIAEADYAEGNHHNNAAFIAHAREDIPALLAEVERLRVDAELGRLVREGLPAIAQHSGDEAWLRYDHLDQMWGAGYTGYAEFSSCDPDNALETVLGDVLRKA